MQVNKILKKYFKPFFYSTSLTLGIYVAIQELHENKNTERFILFSILVFFIYLVEVYSHWRSKKAKVQLNMDFSDDVNEASELFHKIILPVGLYFSIIGFAFYNLKSSSLIFMLVGVFVTFFILFLNIKAFFELKNKLEDKTHYVYDLIKFLIFFSLVNVFSNAANNFPENLSIYGISVAITSFTLLALMLWRFEKLHIFSVVYGSIVSLFIGIVFLLYHAERIVNPLQIALGLFFVFYLASAIIHHIVSKTLSKWVLFEYILVIAIVIGITYGIA